MSEEDSRAGHHVVFRQHWRERQSAGGRLGGLIRQPRWMDSGLVLLAVLLAVGAVTVAMVTVPRTATLPAAVNGATVSAVRGSGPAPAVGSPAQYRDATGATIDAVVVEVAQLEVIAELSRPAPPSAGQLVVPMGTERLFDVLAPRLG